MAEYPTNQMDKTRYFYVAQRAQAYMKGAPANPLHGPDNIVRLEKKSRAFSNTYHPLNLLGTSSQILSERGEVMVAI